MRPSLILTALSTLGLASAVQEYFQVTELDNNTYQACFIEGHEYWFCTKPFKGQWQQQTQSLVNLGCGYYYQFKKGGTVEVGSSNGCGYKSHCTLKWDDEEEKYKCAIITDSPNCLN